MKSPRTRIVVAVCGICLLASPSMAHPPPQDSQAAGSAVVTNVFDGVQLEAVYTAWEAISDLQPDVPALSSMRVTYASDGNLTTVTFSGPSREVERDGRTYLELGSSFYEVSIQRGQIHVLLPTTME
ncbi:MAG: hypothetical protein AB7O98_06025 [Hyphomonadaceae bacterium]